QSDIHSRQMTSTPAGPLQVTAEQSDDTYRVVAAGELDLATSPGLEVALLGAFDSDKQQISVDLTGIDFLDSSGLKVIVEAARRDNGGRLSIAASDAVRRVIELSGLSDRIPMSAS
nr:STAS domain-containing protein [Baekduia sp.]